MVFAILPVLLKVMQDGRHGFCALDWRALQVLCCVTSSPKIGLASVQDRLLLRSNQIQPVRLFGDIFRFALLSCQPCEQDEVLPVHLHEVPLAVVIEFDSEKHFRLSR